MRITNQISFAMKYSNIKTGKPVSLLLLLIVFIALPSFAQTNVDFIKTYFPEQKKEFKKAVKNLKKGDEYFEYGVKGKYAEALDYYLMANNFNPNNAELNFKIGVCYLKSYFKNNAMRYLEQAKKLNPELGRDLNLYLGEAYQYNYEFDKALDCYNAFKSSLTPRELKKDTTNIDKRIAECEYGKRIRSNPNRLIIQNLGDKVNSMWDDYSSFVNSDETVMAFTSRRQGTTGEKINPYDYMYFEDIYFSYKKEGKWSEPENPGKPLNSKTNDATVHLSESGDVLTIYKNYQGQDFIFESIKMGGIWTKPIKLDKEINARNYHQPSATYSRDRKTIIFVSDKRGGQGGNDLYMSKLRDNGRWTSAFNLGKVINSSYDEEAPYLLNDSILYFSSKGHNSMGGYDIFVTKMVKGEWTTPVNVGYPMNSTGDDLFLILAKSGNGYFSSDRQGGYGGMDLYYVMFTMTADDLIAGIPPVTINGSVQDEINATPVFADVFIKDQKSDVLMSSYSTDASGNFQASLTSMKDTRMIIRVKDCEMAKINRKTSGIGTIYSADYDPAKKTALSMKSTLISGSVQDDITLRGLQPVIEILVAETKSLVATIIPDTNGNFSISLPSTMDFLMKIKTTGCQKKEIVVVEKDDNIKDVNYSQSIVNNEVVKLENIYFDFDQHFIRPDAAQILNRHAELFLQHKDWKIRVDGHTDNMGAPRYNKYLSEKRAKAAIDYLVEKGIKRNRFKFGGYGYEKPLSTNETDEGRQLNRRCEFYIVR